MPETSLDVMAAAAHPTGQSGFAVDFKKNGSPNPLCYHPNRLMTSILKRLRMSISNAQIKTQQLATIALYLF